MLHVIVASENQSLLWEDFADHHVDCLNYHRWSWKKIIENTSAWRPFYLMAIDDDTVCGILPLFWQKSVMFGKLLCSIPYFSHAGIVAKNEETQSALVIEAMRIAKDLKADHLELRQRRIAIPNMKTKKNKVMLACEIYPDAERNMMRLSTKMRTNVRRSLKSGLRAEFGGSELLRDFYRVFCLKMRELGTPVYSQRFFEAIIETFPDETFVCRILNDEKIIGAAFLTGYRNSIEVNWSASDPAALALRPNIFLFWNLLCFAGQKGYSVFDFGRSSMGSGTYNFKLQWGALPIELNWNYWAPSGIAVDVSPDNPKYRVAIGLWRRMPLVFTQFVGPVIARHLP